MVLAGARHGDDSLESVRHQGVDFADSSSVRINNHCITQPLHTLRIT